MIVRITQIVVSYRKYMRKKPVTKVMIQKELQAQKYRRKGSSNDKTRTFTQTTSKPHLITGQSPRPSLKSIDMKGDQKNSSKILVFSNYVADKGNEELEESFKKQTLLESHVTMLTIKRTMTCFFAIIFSIPFFISTTYKSFFTEYEPIAEMAVKTRNDAGDFAYAQFLDFFVSDHTDDFDKLADLEALNFTYKSTDFANDDIRDLNLIEVKYKGIKFTSDITKTMRLYAV